MSRENMGPEVEADIPSVSPEMNAPTVATNERSVPVIDSPMEATSPLLVITEGHQSRQFFPSLDI